MFSTHMTTTKFQRVFSRLLLPIFTVWMIINPVRSYAVVPILLPIVGEVALSNGARIALTQVTAAMLGTALAYVAIKNPYGDELRIPLKSGSGVVPIPTGTAPIPTKPLLYGLDNGSAVYAPDAETVCIDFFTSMGFTGYVGAPVSQTNPDGTSSGWCDRSAMGNTVHSGSWRSLFSTTKTCPSGTTITGTAPNQTCAVNDPYQAYPDAKLDYQRDANNNFTPPVSTDADTQTAGLKSLSDSAAITNGGAMMKVIGKNETTGEPLLVEVTSTGVDSGIVSWSVFHTDADGTQYIDRHTTNFGAGVLTSSERSRIQGTLWVDSATDPATQTTGLSPAAAVSVPANPTGQANAPAIPYSPAAPVTINLPTDYAKSGEAVQAANAINSGFVIPTTLDPVIPMDLRIQAMSGVPATPTINWMPSLLPGTATACYSMPIDGGVHGGLLNLSGSASFDICDKLDVIRQILGYFFMISTVVFVFRRFTRSNGESA